MVFRDSGKSKSAQTLRDFHDEVMAYSGGLPDVYRVEFKSRQQSFSLSDWADTWRTIEAGRDLNDDLLAECVRIALEDSAERAVREELLEMKTPSQRAQYLWSIIESAPGRDEQNTVWRIPSQHTPAQVQEVAVSDAAVTVLLSMLEEQLGRRWFINHVLHVATKEHIQEDGTVLRVYVDKDFRDALYYGVQLLMHS